VGPCLVRAGRPGIGRAIPLGHCWGLVGPDWRALAQAPRRRASHVAVAAGLGRFPASIQLCRRPPAATCCLVAVNVSLLISPTIRVGLLGAAGLLASLGAQAQTAAAPRNRTFVLTSTATVPVPPAGTKTLDLWLPVPHADASQDVRDLQIESPVPYKIEQGEYGTRMLHLRPAIVPTAPLVVKLTAQITRREHLNLRANAPTAKPAKEKPDPNLARWLAPDRLVPLDPQIQQQAEEVVAKAHATTPLEKARAIYEHVVSAVKYDKTGQGWGRGDIYYACDARRGNCTDFHAIVIGYCRSLGIPARFSIGLPLPAERGHGEIKGYHCWAEFFTPQTGWVPVDASEAAKNPGKRAYFFGAHDENRVEFTRGRDVQLTPRQAGPPLNYFVYPYAEADGQPLEVVRKYEFADVTAQ
jgi:transglutaminase-like putative cysteine protease